LLVKKTPKYDRLKNSTLIEHPYIQNILLKNWIDAADTHYEICKRFEDVLRGKVKKL
jgi:hypothetical protein